MRKLAIAAVCVFLLVSSYAFGTNATVKRNVNLRTNPSTDNAPITLLHPPDEVELVEPEPSNGYYHVRTEDGQEGWVWSKNLQIAETPSTSSSLLSTAAISTSISENWQKPTPNKTTFKGVDGNCPWDGDNTDPDTFLRKNRSDVPTNVHDVAWQAIHDLSFPNDKPQRKNWRAQSLAEIAKYEGIPVRTVGYIVAFKPQKGHGEGTNCRFTKASETDTHVALVGSTGDGESDSVVIEFTPRFLADHPNWPSKLDKWSDTDNAVRITGWLMFDPDHRNHLNKYRYTLWEIHPITKIEVTVNGQWVDLDNVK
jgi:hypothetical protein